MTIAQYQTPRHFDIDHVGVAPDIKCARPRGGGNDTDDAYGATALTSPLAASLLAPSRTALIEELFQDPCFVAASRAVAGEVRHGRDRPVVPPLPASLQPFSPPRGAAAMRTSLPP